MSILSDDPVPSPLPAGSLVFDKALITTDVRTLGVAVLYDGVCIGTVKVKDSLYIGHLKRTYDDGALVRCTADDRLDRAVLQVAEHWWLLMVKSPAAVRRKRGRSAQEGSD